MAKQFQFRRGTTAAHSTFTGAIGEITVDTTKDTVVVHDGSTEGGFPLPTEAYFNVKDFGAKGDGTTDDTAAFQSAIDLAAISTAGPLSLLHRGGMVVVPRTIAGYVINGLNMRSHVWLLGMGQGILLKMTATDATNCINGLGSLDTEDGQHSWSRIENFIIQGSKDVGGTGNGIYYEEHDNNFLYNLRIRRCGKHGFHGVIAPTSPLGVKSDGLEMRSCYIENCVGNGIHITGGKYTTIGGESRIVNNNSGNIYMEGISCRIIGGAINATTDFYAIHLANSRVITLNNILMEGITTLPAGLTEGGSETAFLRLGTDESIDTVQACMIHNCQFLTTGPHTIDLVMIDCINTRDITIDTCRFDANIDAPGSVIGVRTQAGSAQRTLVKNSNFPEGGINAANSGTSAKYEFNDKRASATEGTKTPYFPTFRAEDASTTSPLNANVNKVINFSSLVFDRTDSWNATSAPAFIAPEDGIYHLETLVKLNGTLNAADSFEIKIISSTETFSHTIDFGEFGSSPTTWTIAFSCLADMARNQGIQVQWRQNGGGNGNITSLGAESYFSGHQVA